MVTTNLTESENTRLLPGGKKNGVGGLTRRTIHMLCRHVCVCDLFSVLCSRIELLRYHEAQSSRTIKRVGSAAWLRQPCYTVLEETVVLSVKVVWCICCCHDAGRGVTMTVSSRRNRYAKGGQQPGWRSLLNLMSRAQTR